MNPGRRPGFAWLPEPNHNSKAQLTDERHYVEKQESGGDTTAYNKQPPRGYATARHKPARPGIVSYGLSCGCRSHIS